MFGWSTCKAWCTDNLRKDKLNTTATLTTGIKYDFKLQPALLKGHTVCKATPYGLGKMNSWHQSSNLIGLAVIQKC